MKIRCDSWAAKLEEDEQDRIYTRWRQSGAAWDKLAEWISEEFKIDAPSRSALYRWREQFEPIHRKRRAAELAHAGDVMKDFAAQRKVTDRECADALMMLGVEATSVTGDAKTGSKLIQDACAVMDRVHKAADLELKAKAQETKEADLALAREKFEAAEKRLNAAAKTVSDDTLTDEQRVGKIKEIFGIK